MVGLLKKPFIKSIAENVNDMAPSVDEADAILAKFGWTEEVALAA